MRKLLHKIAASAMAVAMALAIVPLCATAADTLSTNVTVPFSSSVKFTVPDSTTKTTSNSYRIPAMVTLDDGTIVAAADIRWNTTYDGGGLDTLVARSSDGGVTWEYTVANYLGDNGNEYNGSSTCFIDPCLTVAEDGKTVYMLCDLYPYGVALNGNKETTPYTELGFNDQGYLKLRAKGSSSCNYYLKDGKIYSTNGTEVSGYTVDGYFNVTDKNGNVSNLFYKDAPYQVVRTGFLYLTKSTDGGKTWSEPTLLNLKTSSEYVCLVGPGRGITTSDGTMVFPVYSYGGDQSSQRMGFIYSSDDGKTWQRTQSSVNWSSEAAVVELEGKNTLRFFYRNGNSELSYVDYNMNTNAWGSVVKTGIDTNSNTQLSAITYSKTSDGKQVILVSCPTGPNAAGSNDNNGSWRTNGRIFVGVVNDNTNNTMTWDNNAIKVSEGTATGQLSTPYTDAKGFFAYSCLTERADGSIAILYENTENAWGTGDSCYYAMNMKAYDASALGLTFDAEEEGGDVTPPEETSDVVSDNGVIVYKENGAFTGLTATTLTAPKADYIKNALAYDVTPMTAAGKYTGSAQVTINIPSGWDASNVFGYVKESNGDITILEGKVSSGNAFTYTVPHFSETGIFEATSRAAVNGTTVTLEIGETGDPIVVSSTANVGTQGTFTTTDGAVRYTVTHTSQPGATNNEKMDSLKDGDQIVISDGNGHYLKRNNNSISSVSSISEATVWRVYGSNNSWTIVDESGSTDYYLRPGSNRPSVNSSAGSSKWSYNDNGFNYANIYYLCYQNSSWTMARRNISGYGAAYTVTQTEEIKSTTVTFTGVDVTDGTRVTIGDTTYFISVKAKELEKDAFLITGADMTLDALADLGLSGNGYTVTYTENADADNVLTVDGAKITAGKTTGEATVVATVKNASGKTVGTVTYTVTVSDVKITSVKTIIIPVGGTAEVEGLTGDIHEGMFSSDVATYEVANNGDITFTAGNKEGTTALVVGTTKINVVVAPKGNTANTNSRYLYIEVDKIENCTVYYCVNGGDICEVTDTGILIDQTYLGAFNIMFFAAPDEGFALTEMSGTASTSANGTQKPMTDYYTLSNGVEPDGIDSDAWPFAKDYNWTNDTDCSTLSNSDTNIWKQLPNSNGVDTTHGFRWALIEDNMTVAEMRDMFARAIALDCDGVCTATKNGTESFYAHYNFIAEPQPEFEKTIIGYKRGEGNGDATKDLANGRVSGNADFYNYNDDVTLEIGDTLLYQFTVTSTSTNIEYYDIKLTDSKIGYEENLSSIRYTDTAEYELKSENIDQFVGGKFVNNAQLSYSYSTKYSTGDYEGTSSAEATCKIIGLVGYAWDAGTPAAIVNNEGGKYSLPAIERHTIGEPFHIQKYNGEKTYYDASTNTYWDYTGEWGVIEDADGNKRWFVMTDAIANAEFSMQKARSITFYGRWVERGKFIVDYQWTGDVPPTAVLPEDTGSYNSGDKYTVDGTYKQGDKITIDNTEYTFSGWKLDGEVVTGQQTMGNTNVTLMGVWESGKKHKVSYEWDGEVPSGVILPYDNNRYYLEGTEYTVHGGYNNVVAGDDTWIFQGWKLNGTGEVLNGKTMKMGTTDATYIGVWTKASKYSVEYEWGGDIVPNGVILPTDENRYGAGADYTVDDEYVKDEVFIDGETQYVFSGWTWNGKVVSGTQTMPESDVTLVGTWTEREKYTVSYEWTGDIPAGKTEPASFSLYEGKTYTIDSTYTSTTIVPGDKVDYFFSGWKLSATAEDIETGDRTMVKGGVTYVGVWEAKTKYAINYVWNSDNIHPSNAEVPVDNKAYFSKDTYTVSDKYEVGKIYSDPEGKQYIFDGWKVNGEGNVVTGGTIDDSSITLVGSWHEVTKYTVSYAWNGEAPNVDLPDTKSLYPGTDYKVDNSYEVGEVVVAGDVKYTFEGWKLTDEGEVLNGSDQTMGTENVTYYGTWDKETKKTVSYEWKDDAPEGKNPPADNKYFKGDNYIVDNTYYKVGDVVIEGDVKYTFEGWKLTDDGAVLNGDSKEMGTEDVTYYGYWKTETKHNVSYAWDGEAPTGKNVPVGDSYFPKASYTVDNTYTVGMEVIEGDVKYTFIGWKLEGKGDVLNNKSQTMGDKDVTYYGAWKKETKHNVSYEWKGAAPTGKNVPVGDSYFPKASYTVDNTYTVGMEVIEGNVKYTFVGWKLTDDGAVLNDKPQTMGTDNVTYYGYWKTENQKTVTYTWSGAVPDGATKPADLALFTGEDYTVDKKYTKDTKVETADMDYFFSGWKLKGELVEPGTETKMGTADVEYVGEWTSKAKYGVTYVWADDIVPPDVTEPVDSDKYYENVKYSVDATYKQGDKKTADNGNKEYTFSGWMLNGAVVTGDVPMGNDDVTLVGKWTLREKHFVSYAWTGAPDGNTEFKLPTNSTGYFKDEQYPVDGNYPKDKTITVGNVDYVFSGWKVNGEGSVVTEPQTMGDENVTLIGVWTPKDRYTVTYSWSGEIPAGQDEPTDGKIYHEGDTYTVDGSYSSSTKITIGNVDYTFSGWKLGETLVSGTQTMGKGNVQLTGVWTKAIRHKVIYTWDGEYPEDEEHAKLPDNNGTYYYEGKTYTVHGGYETFDIGNTTWTFLGWKLADGTDYTGKSVEMGTDDVTYYGKWESKTKYNVNYVWTGAIPEGATKPADDLMYEGTHYKVDETYTEDTIVETKDKDYFFSGWKLNDGTDTIVTPGADAVVSGDITYTGVWTAENKYHVTYEWTDAPDTSDVQLPEDTGAYYFDAEYTVDDKYPENTVVTVGETQYIFSGWKVNGEGAVVSGTQKMGNENVTLKGVWKERDKYDVKYEWTGDIPANVELPDSRTLYDGTTYNVDNAFNAETVVEGDTVDYFFSGWKVKDGEDVVVSGNTVTVNGAHVTYEGVWVAKTKYVVHYIWENDNVRPSDAELPEDVVGLFDGDEYTVSTNYTVGKTYTDANGGQYIFQGWKNGNEFVSGKQNIHGASVVLKGSWIEAPKFTVTYEWADETVPPNVAVPEDTGRYYEKDTYTVDGTLNAGDKKYSADGKTEYTFSGWMLDGKVVTGEQKMGKANVTLIGKWTAVTRYNVTYEWAGEELPAELPAVPENAVCVAGSDYTVHSGDFEPINDGTYTWTFEGWKLSGDTVTNYAGRTVKVNGDIVYYGYWTKTVNNTSLKIKKLVVGTGDPDEVYIFKVNGGGMAELTVTVKAGQTVTIDGLKVGTTYTVTEVTNWSWRCNLGSIVGGTVAGDSVSKTLTSDAENLVTFTNTISNNWLFDDAYAKNIYTLSEDRQTVTVENVAATKFGN